MKLDNYELIISFAMPCYLYIEGESKEKFYVDEQTCDYYLFNDKDAEPKFWKIMLYKPNMKMNQVDLDIKYNRWDQDIYKYLLRIKEIADTYKNPLINDSSGASICNDIDKKVDELIKMVLFK